MSTAEQAAGGSIETLRFARLLARFWEQGFTGYFRTLGTLRPGATISKEILFERGRVAWAASDDSQESIRTHLINRGMLRPDQWRLAEEKAGSSQARQLLVELGFLTARELQEADRERVTAIVLSLFGWRDGRYEIAPGPPPHGTPNLKIDPRDLVLEGLMSSGDRGKVLDEIGSLDAVLVVRPDDLVRASLSLPVELVGLMGKADGTRTIADICALSPLSDFLISAAFAGLKVLGLARPVEGGVTAAPPAPPTPAPEKPPTRRRTTIKDAMRETPPMLPLYDAEPADYETVPVAATPPGGVPKTIRMAGARLADLPGRGEGPSTVRIQNADERLPAPPREAAIVEPDLTPAPDDEGTVRMQSPPGFESVPRAAETPLGPPAVPEQRHHEETRVSIEPEPRVIEDSEADPPSEGRETEIELKPGIPVSPRALESPGEHALDDEDIEDAIQIFDSPADDVEHEAAAGPIRISGDDAGEADGSFDEEAGEPDDEGGGSPPWVYEPSEQPSLAGRGRRWMTWGGLAAVMAAAGFGLVVLFGGSRGNPEEAALPAAEVEAPPQDVQPPKAFTSDPLPVQEAPAAAPHETVPSARGEVAAASLEVPQPPPQAPAPATPPPARIRPPAALAPVPEGAILSSGAFKEGRRLLQSGKIGEAAARFAEAVSGRKGLFTVQLALACERSTIERAAGSTRGATSFFIVPTTFKGQSCYRMLWGTYPSRSAATEGRGGVPPAFLKDPHPPVVAPL